MTTNETFKYGYLLLKTSKMTIKKLLTGQPGNIKEFVDMTKSKNLPVNVLFHTWCDQGQGGDEFIRGRIIYSAGNIDEILSGNGIKYTQNHDRVFKERIERGKIGRLKIDHLKRYFTGSEIIEIMQEEAHKNLEHLTNNQIKYQLRVVNQADYN